MGKGLKKPTLVHWCGMCAKEHQAPSWYLAYSTNEPPHPEQPKLLMQFDGHVWLCANWSTMPEDTTKASGHKTIMLPLTRSPSAERGATVGFDGRDCETVMICSKTYQVRVLNYFIL